MRSNPCFFAFSGKENVFKIFSIFSSFKDLYEFNFILVRPDLMVAWRSNLLPDSPRTVLEKISGI